LQFRTKKFECPCHGSVFSLSGSVLTGPAKEALPFFKISENSAGMLVVHFDEVVPSDQRYLPAINASESRARSL
jgi:Rieske Fe-S protein